MSFGFFTLFHKRSSAFELPRKFKIASGFSGWVGAESEENKTLSIIDYLTASLNHLNDVKDHYFQFTGTRRFSIVTDILPVTHTLAVAACVAQQVCCVKISEFVRHF